MFLSSLLIKWALQSTFKRILIGLKYALLRIGNVQIMQKNAKKIKI